MSFVFLYQGCWLLESPVAHQPLWLNSQPHLTPKLFMFLFLLPSSAHLHTLVCMAASQFRSRSEADGTGG